MSRIPMWYRALLMTSGVALSAAALGADPAPAPAAPAAAPALAAAPAPALPIATGSMLANACAGCHGPSGASVGPASPSIAGINPEFFVETMNAFKSGKRHSTVMGRIAKGYTDDEIKAMAKFYAGKKWMTHPQKTDPAKVAKGKTLHKQNCEKCHEEGGRISEDGGILAGQWMPYLTFQMEDFTSGKTKMPEKMEKKVKPLSAADIDALIHFYGSQK